MSQQRETRGGVGSEFKVVKEESSRTGHGIFRISVGFLSVVDVLGHCRVFEHTLRRAGH